VMIIMISQQVINLQSRVATVNYACMYTRATLYIRHSNTTLKPKNPLESLLDLFNGLLLLKCSDYNQTTGIIFVYTLKLINNLGQMFITIIV